MKRLTALLALTVAFAMTGCDSPDSGDPEFADAPMEAPVAPAAADAGAPVAAPAVVDGPPLDSANLPAERRSSEESVQPESETLFY